MEHMSGRTGTFLVILSGICWGVISIFINHLSALGFASLQLVCLRGCVSVLFLLVYFLVRDRSLLKIRLRDLWMFIGTGIVSMTFFTYCYFTSIVRSGAAVSVVLLYTSPIFVMLMSAVVFKEKITGRKILALLMTFVGCVLVAGLVGTGTALSFDALLLGLGAGLGYAMYSIFAGIAVRRYSSLTITFYTLLFSGLSMFFLIDPVEFAGRMIDRAAAAWPYMIGIAVICTVIPYIAYTIGLGRMEAGKAAVLVTVEPLVGAFIGIAVWHEAVDLWKILGMGLIFAAVLMLSIREKTKTGSADKKEKKNGL